MTASMSRGPGFGSQAGLSLTDSVQTMEDFMAELKLMNVQNDQALMGSSFTLHAAAKDTADLMRRAEGDTGVANRGYENTSEALARNLSAQDALSKQPLPGALI